MTEIAIKAEGLSKRYRLGRRERYRTLRDAITRVATGPARWARGLGGRAPAEAPSTLWALKDVSFEVRHGEAVGIIGRNGAGKSTLLKVLSRITHPTTGRAEVFGRVGSLLEVGTGFHPELSGRENVYMNGAILGMRKAEIDRKFDEMVAFAEVEKFLDTPVKHYSSGMYMRLAFSVAAHLEPDILVVDEVLAVGDAAFQRKCLGKMGEVASHGRTVLFVSHNMGAMSRLCTRGIFLSGGAVKVDGRIDEAVGAYVRQLPDSQSTLTGKGVTVRVSFEDASGARLTQWRPGADLVVVADVEFPAPVAYAAVDVAFYSEAGVKLCAVQSDKLEGGELPRRARRVRFAFSIRNVGLAVSELSADVGVRAEKEPGYVTWWQRVETLSIALADLPSYCVTDAMVAPPVRLRVEPQ